MAKRGQDRREKILQVSESIILQKGFSATSIEDILEQAHITKGGFFYHFPGKVELARALIERYLEEDDKFFEQLANRAEELSEDPLQQMLLFLNLLAESMENLEDVHPGCLIASFTYESQQIDDSVKELIQEGILRWRAFFRKLLNRIVEDYPPRQVIKVDEMADFLTSVIEGGIIVSRVLNDKIALSQQIRQYRLYVKLLFEATGE